MLWEAKGRVPSTVLAGSMVRDAFLRRRWYGSKKVGLGTSFLTWGEECDKVWRHEATRATCGLGWGDR